MHYKNDLALIIIVQNRLGLHPAAMTVVTLSPSPAVGLNEATRESIFEAIDNADQELRALNTAVSN